MITFEWWNSDPFNENPAPVTGQQQVAQTPQNPITGTMYPVAAQVMPAKNMTPLIAIFASVAVLSMVIK